MISVNELTILSVRSFIMLNCPPRVKKYGIKASGATNIEKKSKYMHVIRYGMESDEIPCHYS